VGTVRHVVGKCGRAIRCAGGPSNARYLRRKHTPGVRIRTTGARGQRSLFWLEGELHQGVAVVTKWLQRLVANRDDPTTVLRFD
jgi:hypothetical protein